MSSVTIRKGATGELVNVCYDGHTTAISLNDVTQYNKVQYLSALIKWALDGFMGFPPTIKR